MEIKGASFFNVDGKEVVWAFMPLSEVIAALEETILLAERSIYLGAVTSGVAVAKTKILLAALKKFAAERHEYDQ